MASKPVVDGLEEEFEGRAIVVRADYRTDAGKELARKYDIDSVPSFIVFDRESDVIFRRNGSAGVPVEQLREALTAGA
jgi:thioredoxin-related protein